MKTPDDLTIGDIVIITRGKGVSRMRLAAPVMRVTRTTITADGRRFSKETCLELGAKYTSQKFEIATNEELEELKNQEERRAMINFLVDVDWRDRPLEELRRVVAQVEQ